MKVSKVSAEFDRQSDVFEALADPKRLRVFRLLLKRADLSVGAIAKKMDASLPATSQQLKILETAGLLTRQKKGRSVFYRVNDGTPFVRKLITALLA